MANNENNYTDNEEYDEIIRKRMERRREKRKKELARKRKRNRIIMVCVAIIILILLIFGVSSCVSSCSESKKTVNNNMSGATEPTQAELEVTTPTETITELAQNVPLTEIADNGEDGYTTDSGIYIWNNQAFELFYGSEGAAKEYANAISKYRQQIDSSINVYNMIVPIHIAFGLPTRLENSIDSADQNEYINNVYNNYTTAGITPINIFNTLSEHRTEYNYFNTDHHWTGLGSYYAYKEFCNLTGQTPVDINSLTSHSIDGFVGSLYTSTKAEALKNNADTVTYYDMPEDYKFEIMQQDSNEFIELDSMYYEDVPSGSDTYCAFIWGDNPITKITNSNSKNGRKILVVKESYGNAFVPWLINNYDEVHAMDFRWYEGNLATYCNENGITDVLFMNGVMSSASAFQIESMDGLFN